MYKPQKAYVSWYNLFYIICWGLQFLRIVYKGCCVRVSSHSGSRAMRMTNWSVECNQITCNMLIFQVGYPFLVTDLSRLLPAAGPYSGPVEFCLHAHKLFLYHYYIGLYRHPVYAWVSQVVPSVQVLRMKCAPFSSTPCEPYAAPR